MPLIQVNDIDYHYETHGHWPPHSTPLLVLPGLGNDATRWERVLLPLAERLSLLAVDHRGCGRSSSPATDYSITQMAEDAAALLDKLDLGPFHILGHSMGGFIAMELSVERPELVTGLVLASTAPAMSRRNRLLLSAWAEGFSKGVEAEWMIRDILYWMYPPQCFEKPEYMESMVREALEARYPQSLEGLCGQVAACNSFDCRDALCMVQAPGLVLHGELDQLVPLDEAAAMAWLIPGASLRVIEGAGHLPNQQLPLHFAEEVATFLDALQTSHP